MSKSTYEIQRLRIDAQGYDTSGAYWGSGPDVFIATFSDGADEITVRAKGVREARDKIAAELARAPGAPKVNDDPIGGRPPRKTRYEISWRNPVTNETVKIYITHARDYLSSGTDHLEIESIAPKKTPLPITETGYRSHFVAPLELINAGGPVTFVTAWIEQESKSKTSIKTVIAAAQGDLFGWAEAQTDVGKRTRTQRAKSSGPPSEPTDENHTRTPVRRPAQRSETRPRRSKTGNDPA